MVFAAARAPISRNPVCGPDPVSLTARVDGRPSRRIVKRGAFYPGRPANHSSRKACTGFAEVARSAGMSIATIDDKISNRGTPK
jgi:hypothetical protein